MHEFIENWADLESRNTLRLYRKGEFLASGSVDGVMPDGSALWLVQDTFGRALFLKSDGINAVRVTASASPPTKSSDVKAAISPPAFGLRNNARLPQ